MDSKEKEILMNNFRGNIVDINGEEYIKADVFLEAIYNVCFSEALVGVLVGRLGNVVLDRKEITDFMGGDYKKVKTEFSKDKCILTVNK